MIKMNSKRQVTRVDFVKLECPIGTEFVPHTTIELLWKLATTNSTKNAFVSIIDCISGKSSTARVYFLKNSLILIYTH